MHSLKIPQLKTQAIVTAALFKFILPRLIALIILSLHCNLSYSKVVPSENYQILEAHTLPTMPFVQGIEYSNGKLFLSSGGYGRSYVMVLNAETMQVEQSIKIESKLFAEGLSIYNDSLFLLSWKAQRVFKLNLTNLESQKQLHYKGEGWGLANDGRQFIMSNGSSQLSFRNLATFQEEQSLAISNNDRPLEQLNELEYAEGFIWANVWHDANIYKISKESGHVVQSYNMETLLHAHMQGRTEAVLNGIAYDPNRNAYWVTGKLWNKMYLIKFF